MTEKIVVVDENDRELRLEDKEKCHEGMGILHRAFLLVVVRSDGKIVLARRSRGKRLWPGYWDATIASHPFAGESVEEAAARRLGEELGVEAREITYHFKFHYNIPYLGLGAENELCSVLSCRYGGTLRPNPAEVSEVRAVSIQDIGESQDYSPWMKIAFRRILADKII